MCYTTFCYQRKGGLIWIKYGTVIVSVFKSDDNSTSFEIKTDVDDVLPVSYVIEDTLKFY